MRLRYDAGREAFGQARLNWPQDDIVAYLVSDAYRPRASHKFAESLIGIIAGPESLQKRSIDDGYAKADAVLFPRVHGEKDAVGLVVARRDSVLIAYSDEIEDFPMRLNGSDILVSFEPHLFRI